jgi:hypothetical protein
VTVGLLVFYSPPVVWLEWSTFPEGPFRVGCQPNFFRSLDLNDPGIMDDDLHNTEAKLPNLASHNFQPIRPSLFPMCLNFRRHAIHPILKHY